VILGGIVGPDLLHRLDLLAQFLSAGLVNGAVIFHVLGIPATADAEQEATLRHLVELGNQLCGLDCVALDYQTDSSAEFEPLGDGGCGTQRVLVAFLFVLPDITQAILDGRQPHDLTAEKLLAHSRLPLLWHDQRSALGFA
jgi:hypothetical protein